MSNVFPKVTKKEKRKNQTHTQMHPSSNLQKKTKANRKNLTRSRENEMHDLKDQQEERKARDKGVYPRGAQGRAASPDVRTPEGCPSKVEGKRGCN